METILAADIGGTNARFSAFESHGETLIQTATTTLPSTGADSFEELMEQLAASPFALSPRKADALAFAIAGPIQGGIFCSPPNIDWDVDMNGYALSQGISNYLLINDFTAQAYACCTSIMDSAEQVLPGKAVAGGPVAVVGAGTGLGKAVLIHESTGGRLALPTEGGHALFPFIGNEEIKLQQFVCHKLGVTQVIWEHIVSGPGLAHIHEFLNGNILSPHEISQTFDDHPMTMQWAARFYGRACRNFALETLATGGVVISGGVAAKNPQLVRHDAFQKEFRHSETHANLLAEIPVTLNRQEDAGLWGAAYAGLQKINSPK